MNKLSISTKDIANIAMGIAFLICGGFLILQLSMIFPIPGTKYIFMAPFISMVIYFILQKLEVSYGLLIIGIVFGLVMGIFSIFMTIAIVITTLLSQICVLFIKNKKRRNIFGSVLFSMFMGLTALLVSKAFIGGPYVDIPVVWIIITGVICAMFGLVGVYIAVKIFSYIRVGN